MRRWVEGVLAQADGDVAATTLAVMWNGGSAGGGLAAGRHFASAPVATLLHEPFAALGSAAPELDAMLAAHATFGLLSDFLWEGAEPTRRRGRPGDRLLPGRRGTAERGAVSALAPSFQNCSGTQLGARFSMKARMPSRGSGDSARAQNIVW